MTEKNAVITSTFLGKEDHGIPTCYVHLDFGDSMQGFGGWDLRHYGYAMIMGILEAVGAESWEKLSGMNCRIRGRATKLEAIGHVVKDQWYEPEAPSDD